MPLQPEQARYRLFQAVVDFLQRASAERTLVILFEGSVTDADRGTLDLLLYLAHHIAETKLLVIGTYRDVEVDRAHRLSAVLAELRRTPSFDRLHLRGLSADDVKQMLDGIAGQSVTPSLAEAVYNQTEGNSLFAQEVSRYLVEEGLIGAASGYERPLRRPLGPMALPEGLRDVIGKRLSRLSSLCNQVLGVSSVIGRDFGFETVQRVSGLTEEPLLAVLEEATRAGLLEDWSNAGTVRFRFAHALFRQTLYEELFAARRLRLHQGDRADAGATVCCLA